MANTHVTEKVPDSTAVHATKRFRKFSTTNLASRVVFHGVDPRIRDGCGGQKVVDPSNLADRNMEILREPVTQHLCSSVPILKTIPASFHREGEELGKAPECLSQKRSRQNIFLQPPCLKEKSNLLYRFILLEIIKSYPTKDPKKGVNKSQHFQRISPCPW